jgi:dTDP-4-amino-4,6-dideoxygalactose transaminase
MGAIRDIARERGLYLVEDCAHAPGASIDGRMLGTWGDVGCYSFFSNKNLSTGEGGMVVTDRDELADRVRLLRSHGMTTVTLDRYRGHSSSYDVMAHGFNYRSNEMNAALGRVQLQKLAPKNRRRRRIVETYFASLETSGCALPFRHIDPTGQPSFHIMPVILPAGAERSRVMVRMKEKGIQTSVHYPPIHTFTAYRSSPSQCLPVTDVISSRLLTLPLFPEMTASQVDYVVTALLDALDG